MRFNIKEMKMRTTCGNSTVFFSFPHYAYLAPKHLQPNNLSIEDRLSTHHAYFGIVYDYSMRNVGIVFKPTSQTNEQLSTFVAECFELCKFQIR